LEAAWGSGGNCHRGYVPKLLREYKKEASIYLHADNHRSCWSGIIVYCMV